MQVFKSSPSGTSMEESDSKQKKNHKKKASQGGFEEQTRAAQRNEGEDAFGLIVKTTPCPQKLRDQSDA